MSGHTVARIGPSRENGFRRARPSGAGSPT